MPFTSFFHRQDPRSSDKAFLTKEQLICNSPELASELLNEKGTEPDLCERCNKINFQALAHYKPPGGHIIGFHIPHSSLSSLGIRRDCKLCRFVCDEAEARGLLPEKEHEDWQLSFTYELSHIKTEWDVSWLKDPSKVRQPFITNEIRVVCYHPQNPPSSTNSDCQTLIVLHPSISPVPTVSAYGKREVLALEDVSDSKFSPRLLPDSGFVDTALGARWLKLCETLHGETCGSNALCEQKLPVGFTLIDVLQECLIAAPSGCRYVTLSYVWGLAPFLTSKLANVAALHIPSALKDTVPATIKDAMAVVKGLQERFLWVDALCIIQDSPESLLENIAAMGTIYALSSLTIIGRTAAGSDGGLNGISRSHGRITQNVIEVKGLSLVATSPPTTASVGGEDVWPTRGWTYQEELLSRRQLIFRRDQLTWKCRKATWREAFVLEVEGTVPGVSSNREEVTLLPVHDIVAGRHSDKLRSKFIATYQETVTSFFARDLKHTSDKLNGFKAIEAALCLTNNDRFIFGLPESCFSHALSWSGQALQRNQALHKGKDATNAVRAWHFPSWSWCGWHGGWLRFVEAPLATSLFHYWDGSGRWSRIKERDVLGRSAATKNALEDEEASPLPPAPSFRGLPLLRFHTSTVSLIPVGASTPDIGGEFQEQPWCIFEAPLTDKKWALAGHGRLPLECVIDADAIWEYVTRSGPHCKRHRKSLRNRLASASNHCVGIDAAVRSFEAAAIGIDSHGQTICLIIEWKHSEYAERVGKICVAEKDWLRLEKRQKYVTLA